MESLTGRNWGEWRHLQGKQEEEGFHAVETAVDKVAHEQVVGLRAVPANLEQLDKVIELAVDVAACANIHLSGIHVTYVMLKISDWTQNDQ